MFPKRGTALATRQRKSCASSSAEGALKLAVSTPAGFTLCRTCRAAPSLPLVSMPWSTINTAWLALAWSSSCNSPMRWQYLSVVWCVSSLSRPSWKHELNVWSRMVERILIGWLINQYRESGLQRFERFSEGLDRLDADTVA